MTSSWRCCCYVAILMTIPAGVITYNFDTDNVIIYEDAARSGGFPGSYAGYSVALWNPGDRGINESWIFIGAPRANTTAYPGMKEPGTVLKCKIREKCEEWVMESRGNMGPVEGSWLGGTMEIGNTTDPNIVVCAPRWLDKNRENLVSGTAWAMKGICYHAKAESLANKAKGLVNTSQTKGTPLILPYRSRDRLSYLMAAFGFSIHIVPDGSHPSIIFGAPGFGYGEGSPIQYNSNTQRFSTPQLDITKKYEYNGYAVTSGFYFGREYGRLYASSSPRSTNLYGKVVLFKFDPADLSISIREIHNGKQVGEYFGSALASCDINGDGIDSLIVGAPHWSKIVDEGRISVFRKQISQSLKETQFFEGEKPRGRFGTTITCLGDIDYDGYADVAVGAPYEDNGVVYIYHGSKDGLSLTQKISGSQGTKGFGISISQPRDIDNNDYADIAVGAYLSGHVTLFRSKRAVTTQVSLSTDLSGKDLPRNATSFLMKVCSSYSGRHAPQELNVTKELKIDELYQRAEIEINGQKRTAYEYSRTLRLKGPHSCDNFTIHIKHGKRNFLKPLTFSVIQSLNKTDSHGTLLVRKNGTTSGEDFFDSHSTITNTLQPSVENSTEVRFAVKCGSDNLCKSRLLILRTENNLKSGNRYVIGSSPNMTLGITIQNNGDPAYSAEVVVTVPRFIRLIVSQSSQDCSPNVMGESMQVICNVGDPLDRNETKDISLDFDLSSVKLNIKEIPMDVKAITSSKDDGVANHVNFRIYCKAETDIGIIRKFTMDRYSYNLDEKKEQLPSIAFQHIYEIKNYEVTEVAEALLSVSIPTHWIDAGNEIEIIRLNKTTGYLEGQEFHCEDAKTDTVHNSTSYDGTTNTEWFIGDGDSTRFEVIDGKIFAASPDNRTLHINCTNPSIKWKTINCKINNFENTQSVARLALKFELLLSNFTPGIIQEKDIIFFVTNGSVRILGQPGETINNEPNLVMIGTIFTGYPGENPLPGWVIPVSILVGLLLLILLALGLYKFGFFKRNKQMELRALLEENNETTAPVIPRSSRGSSSNFT